MADAEGVRVLVLSDHPSPYQVELFDRISALGEVELAVAYLRLADPERSWSSEVAGHRALWLSGMTRSEAEGLVEGSELVVFNFYDSPVARRLMWVRASAERPWVFWGERPGYRLRGWLGRLVRRWRLAVLHRSPAPVWGIGRFGVEGYRAEFGTARRYEDFPYYSDLARFAPCSRPGASGSRTRRVLFSGSLTGRKGVDLLARAFVRVSARDPRLELAWVGEGSLRSELQTLLRPVEGRVHFLGRRSWSDLPAEYARADFLCLPSRHDGWGLVVPEGLASGLPVIGTDRTGAAIEFIETGRNGWLVEAGDGAALEEALAEAAALSDRRYAEMSVAATASVSLHTLENGARRFGQLCRSAVDGWGASTRSDGRGACVA